jgi:enoyl-CoA hydratase/carnithine racemase
MTAILQSKEHGVLTLTINRVDKKNALTADMYATLAEALSLAAASEEVRVVLLQGHETVFSAGNDIADFLQQPPASPDSAVSRFLRGQTFAGFGMRSGSRCGHHHAVALRPGLCRRQRGVFHAVCQPGFMS